MSGLLYWSLVLGAAIIGTVIVWFYSRLWTSPRPGDAVSTVGTTTWAGGLLLGAALGALVGLRNDARLGGYTDAYTQAVGCADIVHLWASILTAVLGFLAPTSSATMRLMKSSLIFIAIGVPFAAALALLGYHPSVAGATGGEAIAATLWLAAIVWRIIVWRKGAPGAK